MAQNQHFDHKKRPRFRGNIVAQARPVGKRFVPKVDDKKSRHLHHRPKARDGGTVENMELNSLTCLP